MIVCNFIFAREIFLREKRGRGAGGCIDSVKIIKKGAEFCAYNGRGREGRRF